MPKIKLFYLLSCLSLSAATGCLPSDSLDDPGKPDLVYSYALQGSWCTIDRPGSNTCLTIDSPASGQIAARYIIERPSAPHSPCREYGTLTGSLEFLPDTQSRLCLAPSPSLYSAQAVWTATGIRLDMIDSATQGEFQDLTLDLHYIDR
jgi:hypothetical protein